MRTSETLLLLLLLPICPISYLSPHYYHSPSHSFHCCYRKFYVVPETRLLNANIVFSPMPPSPPLRSTSPSSPAYSDDEPMSSPPSSTTTPTTKPSSTSRGARRSSSDKENDNMMSRSSRNRGGINPDGSSDDSEQAKLDKLTGQDIFDPNQDRNERRKILGEYRQIGKEFEGNT